MVNNKVEAAFYVETQLLDKYETTGSLDWFMKDLYKKYGENYDRDAFLEEVHTLLDILYTAVQDFRYNKEG